MSVGQRIAFYRQRRGLTQAVLAGMVGRTEDWLSKVERGERHARRVDVLANLARELHVTLGDLLGQPVLAEDADRNDDVPAIRDALMTPRRLSRVLYRTAREREAPPSIAWAELHVDAAWRAFQEGRVGAVIASLPDLITLAQQLEDAVEAGPRSRESWAVSARTHHLAATTLSKVGEADLAWIAAERAMNAADQSDDTLVLASAARACTHALLATGRYHDALDLGITATNWLREQAMGGEPEALSLFGMLNLRTAVAAARNHDRHTAADLIGQADAAAERLGEDANYWRTSFGPTNVALHRVAVALDLGDIRYVVDHRQIDASRMPIERRVAHMIGVARALSFARQDTDALEYLLSAEQEAPTLVRQSTDVRETVKTLRRRSPVAGGQRSSDLLGLAERCHAVA